MSPRKPGRHVDGLGRAHRALGYAWAVITVTATTALSVAGRDVLALPDIAMIFMLGITLVAARFGRGPSALAAALSVGSYDFFVIPPVHQFVVNDARHFLTFATMFGVGLIVSNLTARLRGQELKAKTEELRSSLLSTVSHDLRTPLAAITGAATTLRDDPVSLSATERADLIVTICEEADRLERLVGNLLDMTRLESGGVPVKRLWIAVEELVGSALSRVDKKLGGRPVAVDLPDDLVLVSVDPVLIEQVFVNLLDNAAKYTPPEAPVDIRCRRTQDSIVIEVADRGPGIERELRERIFEKFYRGPHGDHPGAGLGLAISRGIVEAHGGSLVADERPGGGTVFRITLPAATNAPPVPADPESLAGVEGTA